MIPTEIKADVLELAAIAKECPDNLQERCFELLLAHYLEQSKSFGVKPADGKKPNETSVTETNSTVDPPDTTGASIVATRDGSDLTSKDLHVKAKRFLEKWNVTLADLNQVFYKEGDEILPLYEDLKTTKAAESQIRIGLLQALVSGIKSGEFEFDGEVVRKECQLRKCYDSGNFSANFKNNAALFDGFEKYDKNAPKIRLSEAGREAAAKAINELR